MRKIIVIIIGIMVLVCTAHAFLINETYMTDQIIQDQYTHDKTSACENLIDDAITINPYPGCRAEIIVLTTDGCADNYHTKMYNILRKMKFPNI